MAGLLDKQGQRPLFQPWLSMTSFLWYLEEHSNFNQTEHMLLQVKNGTEISRMTLNTTEMSGLQVHSQALLYGLVPTLVRFSYLLSPFPPVTSELT